MEDDRNTAAQRTRTEGGTQEERTERKDTADRIGGDMSPSLGQFPK